MWVFCLCVWRIVNGNRIASAYVAAYLTKCCGRCVFNWLYRLIKHITSGWWVRIIVCVTFIREKMLICVLSVLLCTSLRNWFSAEIRIMLGANRYTMFMPWCYHWLHYFNLNSNRILGRVRNSRKSRTIFDHNKMCVCPLPFSCLLHCPNAHTISNGSHTHHARHIRVYVRPMQKMRVDKCIRIHWVVAKSKNRRRIQYVTENCSGKAVTTHIPWGAYGNRAKFYLRTIAFLTHDSFFFRNITIHTAEMRPNIYSPWFYR